MKTHNRPKPARPIPCEVRIGKKKYTINQVEVIPGCRGECNYDTRTINIAARSAAYAYTAPERFNTFWHELTHAILHEMGSPLEGDEKFVSKLADLLTEAITTAKFKE